MRCILGLYQSSSAQRDEKEEKTWNIILQLKPQVLFAVNDGTSCYMAGVKLDGKI